MARRIPALAAGEAASAEGIEPCPFPRMAPDPVEPRASGQLCAVASCSPSLSPTLVDSPPNLSTRACCFASYAASFTSYSFFNFATFALYGAFCLSVKAFHLSPANLDASTMSNPRFDLMNSPLNTM
eukprot:CAMPEP_0176256802 /NCGR_PEP_ID=MMETSP0121_2-20121125/37727_1 /TAXON_ID=160619 /ORGANISM="Kryptoperidinium foliaceum, Strain CCMP 1326" /LENGTH=126 /DNA_ID=CAMNT_0017596637 /DNA_START=166 /DNA_END=546 /DNA_ORIENTATION=+